MRLRDDSRGCAFGALAVVAPLRCKIGMRAMDAALMRQQRRCLCCGSRGCTMMMLCTMGDGNQLHMHFASAPAPHWLLDAWHCRRGDPQATSCPGEPHNAAWKSDKWSTTWQRQTCTPPPLLMPG
eukprot:1156119-Pelagomonas_calceolata.AAC.6